MRRSGLVWVLVTCFALSCSRDEPSASRPKRANEVPLVHAVVPDPGALLHRIGSSRAAAESALSDLVGRPVGDIDYARPVHIVMFDPQEHAHPYAVVHAGGIVAHADVAPSARALREKLATGPVPKHPTVTVYAKPLRAAYGDAIERRLSMMEAAASIQPGGQRMAPMLDMMRSLVDQLEAITLAVELDGSPEAHVSIGLVALDGSTLARIAADQKPCPYALPARVDIHDDSDLFAAGCYPRGTEAEAVMSSLAGMAVAPGNERAAELNGRLMKLYEGEMVMGLRLDDGLWFSWANETSDGDRARALARELWRTEAQPGMRVRDIAENAFERGGVAVDEYRVEYDAEDMTAQGMFPPAGAAGRQRAADLLNRATKYHSAFVDNVHLATTAGDSALIERLIDRLQSGETAAEPAVIQRSRERGESLVIQADLGALAKVFAPAGLADGWPTVTHGVAFANRGVNLRVTLPAKHVDDALRDIVGE